MTRKSSIWQAEASAVLDAEQALGAALATRGTSHDADSLAGVLEAVGQLVALDVAERFTGRLEGLGRVEILSVLERDAMGDALADSALSLCRMLANQDDDHAGSTRSLAENCAALLGPRDRAEHELLGAAFVLGCAPETLASSSSARWVFDDVVRPETWRLVAVNELRQASLSRIAPSLRARFWWWHDGAAVNVEAVAALGAAAQLVAKFPHARVRFDSLVRAQAIWDSSAKTSLSDAGPVRTLRAWLTRRSPFRTSTGDAPLHLPLAAAAGDEHTVLENCELQLSFAAPSRLIVDLLSDRRPGAPLVLRTSRGLSVTATSVANTNERFAFELSDAILDEGPITISVPLTTGDLDIVLPEPDSQ